MDNRRIEENFEDFQFSLWDSKSKIMEMQAAGYINFQFSLWDSEAFESGVKLVLFFQFSLWDSENLKNELWHI